jgi:RNA-directed DNA polymerase
MGADYTRYADDLTFSGGEELARGSKRFATLIASIVAEEGFRLNHEKTRMMTRSSRQLVTGVVVNVKTNVKRIEFDRLKATLLNCVRLGPVSQNREQHSDFRAHLSGRLAQLAAINPVRARKLWILFDRIVWTANPKPETEKTGSTRPSA